MSPVSDCRSVDTVSMVRSLFTIRSVSLRSATVRHDVNSRLSVALKSYLDDSSIPNVLYSGLRGVKGSRCVLDGFAMSVLRVSGV